MTEEYVTQYTDLARLKGWQYEHHDLIADVNTAVSSVAEIAADAPIRDTRLENVETLLASIILRLVALEKAADITPKPDPTPKPLPEPDVIVTPDIVHSVKPVVKIEKQGVEKQKRK